MMLQGWDLAGSSGPLTHLTAFLTQHFHKSIQIPHFFKGTKAGHDQYKDCPLGFLRPPACDTRLMLGPLFYHTQASPESLPRVSVWGSDPIPTSC